MPVQGTLSDFLTTPKEKWIQVPDDLFSEESDFHGDEATKAYYNKLAASYDPRNYWKVQDWNIQVKAEKAKQAQQKEADEVRVKEEEQQPKSSANLPVMKPEDAASDSKIKQEGGDRVMLDDGERMDIDEPTAAPDTSEQTKMESEATSASTSRPHNFYEGMELAKQLSESLTDFLDRLPPSQTPSSRGHWIYIANPYPPLRKTPSGKVFTEAADVATFRQLGTRLLEDFLTTKEQVESQNPGKAAGTITRLLRPERERLDSGVRDLARDSNITTGKWMLFPSSEDVDRVWSLVAQGTLEGTLGIGAKVATSPDPESAGVKDKEGSRLICVYTHDFADKEDVKRVLLGLKKLGLLNGGGGGDAAEARAIYYKSDAYTYLDISSGNEYKLKASMFSSRDILGGWSRQ
ncbi:hypothetical protein LTS17_000976 [Exophiala oligosperma]